MQPEEFSFTVHPSSGVPIYRQIMDQVAAMVSSGRAKPDDAMPSIRALAQTLEVNMMTVSKAYSRLEAAGVLRRLRGRGMVVAGEFGTPTAGLKERQAELRDLAEQAVVRGLQLKLTDRQILAVIQSLLKEHSSP